MAGYLINTINPDEAKTLISTLKFALVYENSKLLFGDINVATSINWNEVQEARFFNDTQEIHFFLKNGKMNAIDIKDNGTSDQVTMQYCLANRYSQIGTKLLVREYYAYDEDGQAYVEKTRLAGIQ